MFERVVVAVDGPEMSELLVPAVLDLLGPHADAELLLLAASEGPGAREIDEFLKRRFLSEGRVRILRRGASPVEAILDAVGGSEASLVALSRTGFRRRLADVLIGDVADRLLRDCPAPVLTVPRGGRAGERRGPRVVLLPLQDESDWRAPAACAAELARRHEACVVVLRAAEAAVRPAAERQAQEVCGELVGAGVVAHAFVEEGPPARAILEASAAHEADLIVMARGVTADEALQEARVPLMAVPAALAAAWASAGAAAAEG